MRRRANESSKMTFLVFWVDFWEEKKTIFPKIVKKSPTPTEKFDIMINVLGMLGSVKVNFFWIWVVDMIGFIRAPMFVSFFIQASVYRVGINFQFVLHV